MLNEALHFISTKLKYVISYGNINIVSDNIIQTI